MHSNKTQEIRDIKNFPRGNHKWIKPHNFLKDRINTKSKTQKHKDDLPTAVVSLSLIQATSALTHAPQWVSVCVINREAHSLFIFFHSLNVHSNKFSSLTNYLPGPTSLGKSNNPSAPKLWGLFPLIN